MNHEQIKLLGTLGALIAAVVSYTAFYYTARARKGGITIHLDKPAYHPTDTIAVSVEMVAKKRIQCHELTVALQRMVHQSYGNYAEYVVDHSQSKQLAAWRVFEPGEKEVYRLDFTVDKSVPSVFDLPPGFGALKHYIQNYWKYTRMSYVRWRIHVYLRAEGVDLEAQRRVIFLKNI